MTIGVYSINDYWCLFYKWLLMVILLVVIDGYFIGVYWCLLMAIIIMVIVPIILVDIGAY